MSPGEDGDYFVGYGTCFVSGEFDDRVVAVVKYKADVCLDAVHAWRADLEEGKFEEIEPE